MAYGVCKVCGQEGELERHHIVSRKQQPALIKCEKNLASICIECHKGTRGAHGKYQKDIQRKLKLEFQEYLFSVFKKEMLSVEDIKETLKIPSKDALMLVRLLYPKCGLYEKEDVIRACMGGKLVI